jgi:Zinc carboxypeptidase
VSSAATPDGVGLHSLRCRDPRKGVRLIRLSRGGRHPEGGFRGNEVSTGSRGADRARGACVHRHGYRRGGLNAYKVDTGAKGLAELKRQGFDITEGHRRGGIEIVATREQVAKLRGKGLKAKLLRDRRGRTAKRAAAAQAADGWQVWRPYARTDVPVSDAAGNSTDNLVTQLRSIARRYDGITELVTIGQTLNGVPIYAMRVTRNADRTPDGRRPAVLYSATQHAREWLAGETNRRTLRLFVDNYGEQGAATGTDGQAVEGVSAGEITRLVNTRELWFIPIANPDGYDFTFDPENRLWRKNLRDNNGDGQITRHRRSRPEPQFPDTLAL